MTFLPSTVHLLTWTKQHKPHLRKPPCSCTWKILQQSHKLVKLSDISQPPLGNQLSRAHRKNSPPRYCIFSCNLSFHYTNPDQMPIFFSSLYKNDLPRITTQKKEPNILSGNTCILYLKKGWKTLALSLLSRPPHTKIVILWKTIQEWITPRTANYLLLTQPKQAFFSYKHHYQSELQERSTTKPSTNSLTEGFKTQIFTDLPEH